MYYAPARHHHSNDSFHDLMKAFFNHYPEWNNTLWPDDSRSSGMKVKIREKDVRVTLPFPGVTAKDFEVEVVGDTLTVRAHRSQENKDEGKHYLCRERSTESYQESIRLPVRVNGPDTKAKYEDGVLTLLIPREDAAAGNAKTIKVD